MASAGVSSPARAGQLARCRVSAWLVIGLGVLVGSVAGVGLVVVISAGFALSFDAVSAVGRASGVRPELAWLLPAAVDGAMAVGAVTAVVVRRLGRSTVYPWLVVLVNAGISVAGNGLHAYAGASMALPGGVAVAVSAVPAINLALSVHLLVVLVEVLADAVARSAPVGDGAEQGLIVAEQYLSDDSVRPERCVASDPGSGGGDAVVRDGPTAAETVGSLDTEDGPGGRDVDGRLSGRGLQRAAWQWAQRNRRSDGSLVSGDELARAFGRSPRWGRYVKHAGSAGILDS